MIQYLIEDFFYNQGVTFINIVIVCLFLIIITFRLSSLTALPVQDHWIIYYASLFLTTFRYSLLLGNFNEKQRRRSENIPACRRSLPAQTHRAQRWTCWGTPRSAAARAARGWTSSARRPRRWGSPHPSWSPQSKKCPPVSAAASWST